MKLLSLKTPGYDGITPPPNIPGGPDAPSNIIKTFIEIFLVTGVVFAVIFALYGGVLWITSAGDKGKVDRARRTIVFSVIGLIVMILAFTIVQTIGYLLGSQYLSNLGKY